LDINKIIPSSLTKGRSSVIASNLSPESFGFYMKGIGANFKACLFDGNIKAFDIKDGSLFLVMPRTYGLANDEAGIFRKLDQRNKFSSSRVKSKVGNFVSHFQICWQGCELIFMEGLNFVVHNLSIIKQTNHD
jgi:hypothetical protein